MFVTKQQVIELFDKLQRKYVHSTILVNQFDLDEGKTKPVSEMSKCIGEGRRPQLESV